MKADHSFILSPGRWLGEGKIRLSMIEEELVFFTRWKVEEVDSKGNIECVQEIQVKGLSDIMTNHFFFSGFSSSSFSVLMENHAVGKVIGTGITSFSRIGWEFRAPEIGFEGFEFYEKQSDESYSVRGEFSTNEDLRTVILGRIWRQISPLKEDNNE